MPPSEYTGKLRPEITLIDGGAQVDWYAVDTNEIVWTETCTPQHGHAFASQIECVGEFRTRDGYFRDADGNRHFVMQADTGKLGALME